MNILDSGTVDPTRLALLALFSAAFMLYVWNTAVMWRGRTRPSNLLAAGFLAVLGYLAAGQIKAAAYGVSVDGLTYFGVAAASTVIVALVLLQLGGVKHGEA